MQVIKKQKFRCFIYCLYRPAYKEIVKFPTGKGAAWMAKWPFIKGGFSRWQTLKPCSNLFDLSRINLILGQTYLYSVSIQYLMYLNKMSWQIACSYIHTWLLTMFNCNISFATLTKQLDSQNTLREHGIPRKPVR